MQTSAILFNSKPSKIAFPDCNVARLEKRFDFSGVRKTCFVGTLLIFASTVFVVGCSSTNNLTLQGQVSDLQNQRVAVQNERDALETRCRELTDSNRVQVHEIAASQQQIMTLKQEQLVLQKQLQDTLAQVASARQQSEYLSQQLARYEDLRRQQESGAQILSNNSEAAAQEVSLPTIPGTVVSAAGGKIHIEMPGDTLFEAATGAVSPRGMELIRQVGRAVSSIYPGAKVEIQGHASSFQKVSANFSDIKGQTMSQAMSVRDILVREKLLPDQVLNITACGANSPINSSATEMGAKRNYRVELVVTPTAM